MLLAACEGPPDDVARVVVVRATDRFVTAGGVAERRGALADLEAWRVNADGAWQLPVTVAGGLAVVPRTPLSELELRYRDRWFTADDATVDLGADRLGRADAQPAPGGAEIALSVGGLSPWQSGDQLELYSPGAGAWMLAPLGADDSATEAQAVLPWDGNLVRASAGDRLLVAQLDQDSLDGEPYLALARAAELLTVEMTGGRLPVQVALADAPRESFAVDWRIAAFDAVRLRSQAVIAEAWYDAGLAAMPAADSLGNYDLSADLVTMRVTDRTGRDLHGSFDYGRPAVADWPVVATVVAWYPAARGAVGGDAKAILFDALWIRDRAGALDGAPLAPTLGPPERLRVNGADAAVARAGVGPSAQIAWDPPSLGEAAGYQLVVYSLASRDGQTRDIGEVELRTTRTAARLPPGAVAPEADAFVVQVWALAVPADLAARPLSVGLPQAEASVTSATLSP